MKNHKNHFNHIKITVLIFFLCLSTSCEDEYVSPIPYREVYLTLDLTSRDYKLKVPWQTDTFTVYRKDLAATDRLGYGGIIVINGYGEGNINLFAYDMACPNESNPLIRVEQYNTLYARCPKCGAVYDIAYGNGNTVSGSKNYLKVYRISRTGENKYRITN
jgi:nitrite reductase/ring-hydroxylating ferredoxin subunit